MARTAHWSLLLLISLVVFACNPDDLADSDTESADTTDTIDTIDAVVRAVHTIMREDVYLWADHARAQLVDPFDYGLHNLKDMIFQLKSPQDRFTSILAVEDAGKFKGKVHDTGLYMRYLDDTLRVLFVEPGSPASMSGIDRGQWIKAITRSGERVVATPPGDLFAKLTQINILSLGGYAGDIEVGGRGTNNTIDTLSLHAAPYDIQPVATTKVLDVDDKKVGYILFTTFLGQEDIYSALTESFKAFKANGVEYLVLDLRYNSGGRVDVAEHLLNLIYSPGGEQTVMYEYLHNKDNQKHDTTVYFSEAVQSLNPQRLYVLMSSSTASASELVINCLKPFTELNMVLVGEQSVGKNVGSYIFALPSREAHTHLFLPVSFHLVNKEGSNNFENGFAPNITVDDKLHYPLGHEEESLLNRVLDDIKGNSPPSTDPPVAGPRRRDHVRVRTPGLLISTRNMDKHSIWLRGRK